MFFVCVRAYEERAWIQGLAILSKHQTCNEKYDETIRFRPSRLRKQNGRRRNLRLTHVCYNKT